MTPDAATVYIPARDNGLYKSTNLFSGSPTFTKITSAAITEQTWTNVVISSDGTYVVASTDAKTYYSKDSGSTWQVGYTGLIKFMAISDDAHYVIGGINNYANKLLLSNT